MNRFVRTLLIAATVAAVPFAASASAYPNKPVRIVVPFPPGGTTDILAREIGERLSQALGQTFLIENKAGASGNIGIEHVTRAAPDGYTLAIGSAQTLTINPQLFKNLSFEPQKDLAPIVTLASVPNVLLVTNTLPVKTPAELVAHARANPGKLNYASTSVGGTPHLSAELFNFLMKTKITHVPYKGSAPALTDLIGGQIEMMFDNLPSALPHIRAGKVRALAVTTLARTPSAPELPTLHESGVEGFESQGWFALLAPASTPTPVIARLNAEVNKILATDDFRARLTKLGAEAVGGSPADLRERMRSEAERWGKVIRFANISNE